MDDEIIIATEWGDFPFPKNTPKSEIIQQMEAIIAQEKDNIKYFLGKLSDDSK